MSAKLALSSGVKSVILGPKKIGLKPVRYTVIHRQHFNLGSILTLMCLLEDFFIYLFLFQFHNHKFWYVVFRSCIELHTRTFLSCRILVMFSIVFLHMISCALDLS